MTRLIPLLLLSCFLLTSCEPDPPEVVEIKQTSLEKPSMDAVLLCVAKPTEGDERLSQIVPRFILRNDRYYTNNQNWIFKDVGRHWCNWDDQFNTGRTFSFELEPNNGQAAAAKELLVWHARQGELITEITAKTAQAKITPENGMFRGEIVLHTPGATVIVINPDLTIELPDI
jgi:hypothetical protein